MNLPRFFKTKNFSLALPSLLLMVTLAAGFFLVRFLEGMGSGYLREQSEDVIEAMTTGIQNELESAQFAGGAMAGSPWVFPALLEPGPGNIENANSVLDRYNTNLGFSVCYLLNSQGNTIASSNRNAPESFVGKNYAFRPYFQEAMQGNHSVYLAAGATSLERGFYAACPVKDKEGKILGAAVIKKNIDAMRRVLAGSSNTFFLSPDGVIFISGSKDTVLRPLWPLSGEQVRVIRDSKQFNIASFEPVLSAPVQAGEKIRYRGELCQVFREPLGPPGWSLVLLAPLKSVFYFILFGWIITAFMAGIILILMLWSSFRIKGQATLSESQERFSAAFESSGIGMALVRSDGRWLEVNEALCRIVGYTEEELQGKTFQDMTHPEDLEADLAQVRRLLAGEFRHYSIEKRYFHKEGRIVWVLLTVSLVRNTQGVPLYFVCQIEDITEHKAMEEKLGQKISELERFNRIAVDRELKMIELKTRLKALEEGKK
jgi:PAS domain S-box-containing protein